MGAYCNRAGIQTGVFRLDDGNLINQLRHTCDVGDGGWWLDISSTTIF